MSVRDHIESVIDARGAAFVVLLDPDNEVQDSLGRRIGRCEEAGVDAFFVGGSLVHRSDMDAFVRSVRDRTDLPVIGFPGAITQITAAMDALLYLSVVSGRNPDFLFGQHVYAAPIIRRLGLETISTAYMLIESGSLTTAQYMNHSLPIPRNKPGVAAATALAAEMMGMEWLFTDAGSGADRLVPVEMVAAIREACSSPLIVGGGLRRPVDIAERVEAGASIIVVGNGIEERDDRSYVADLASAAHISEPKSLP